MSGEIFGRDAELGMLEAFLAGLPSAARALVIAGPAGAGKTTLLRAAAARAADLGYAVVQTLPSQSDVRLAFAGLADLLGSDLEAILDAVPAPQRTALEIALLVQDPPPGTPDPDPHAIAAAFRAALLAMARFAPVLVCIDDVQWLDLPTEAAVSFAFRRLDREPIGLLCSYRVAGPGAELPLELGRARLSADELPVGGLSLGALHRLLRTRLGNSFSHQVLRRIHDDCGGNPFIALEIGRALARRGVVRVGSGALPVPDTLSGLVGERLRELPPAASAALQLVAVMPGAPVGRYLEAGMAGADLDDAVLAGVLTSDDGRLRFSHPLLSSAVMGAIPPTRRRELHALAARSARRPEERARHRALAAAGASEPTAAELDEAARQAAARGAPAAAAELYELAASLTPDDHQDDAHRRILAAARQLATGGESQASLTMLEDLVAVMPPGPDRAWALGLLGWNREDDFEASSRLLEQALAGAGDDVARTAELHFYLTDVLAIRGHLDDARAHAHLALADAERSGDPSLLASLLAQAFFFDWVCGIRADERQLHRALELEERIGSTSLRTPPSQVAGVYLTHVGRLAEAEIALRRALARAEANGVEYWQADVLQRLSVLAGRRGELSRATELAAAGLQIAEQLDMGQLTSALSYACGLAALQEGRADQARACARRGLELSAGAGDRTYLFGNEALLGAIDLACGDYAAAAARLRPLTARLPWVGRRPNSQHVLPDTAEALIAIGQLDQARVLLDEMAVGIQEPVTAASYSRCRGALAAACGDLDAAVAELAEALRLHDQSDPQPLERGRTLLMLGAVRRRLKQRGAARQNLAEAAGIFEDIGAALWAQRARAELARVSGRAPASGELTVAELRVAELVAQGLTNRQAAAELFLSVRAIESTLTKVYAKLGVRTRTQLAGHLHGRA
jgi:DNA-binding CsgD family transcriptional regulator